MDEVNRVIIKERSKITYPMGKGSSLGKMDGNGKVIG